MSKHDSDSTTWQTYGRILKYVRPYLWIVVICVFTSIGISILHFASLGMIKPIGDVLFSDGGEILLQQLRNWGSWGQAAADFLKENVFSDRSQTLYILMILISVLAVIKNVLRFIQDCLNGYLTNRVTIDISNELFSKVLFLPRRYFSQEGTTQISARFAYDVPMMGLGVRSVFGKAIREPLKALSSVILALFISWKLTLFSLFIFPVLLVVIRKIGKKIRRAAKKTLAKSSNLLDIIHESFQGIDVVKSYQMEKQRREKFAKENQKLLRYSMKVVRAEAATSPIMEIFITGAGVGLLIFSAEMVLQGQMTTGDFCAFYAALGALFDPIRKLANVYTRISSANAAGERVFQLMDAEPEKDEVTNPVHLGPVRNSIVFQNVSFGYDKNHPVLKNISFEVKKGERIAIVGPNGSGKSTLISLLLRFYEVDQGAIIIDGCDIRQASLASLRQQIALVSQQSFLFNDTLAANIATYPFEDVVLKDVEQAAAMADAESFIQQLPDGYFTLYGKGGTDLSGGQKQRLTIARALMKDPSILILDEVTANIDVESEHYIQSALDEYMQDRTTFIIAHRFNTIERADRILVLNQGEVESMGTHEELLKQSDTYRSLYAHQTDELKSS